jgi:hypothetical protein
MRSKVLVLSAAALCLSALSATPLFAQHYSEWSPPLNLGPVVNTTCNEIVTACGETEPFLSRDGLALYFTSNRPGGFGGYDIYVTRRSSRSAAWGEPQNIGAAINTWTEQGYPTLSLDGHRLYLRDTFAFVPAPDNDLYVARRHDAGDDAGWEFPVNLGVPLNSPVNDACLTFFEDDITGRAVAYFQSSRTSGVSGRPDIYATVHEEDGSFAVPVLVAELSTLYNDRAPSVRRDGLEIYFDSNRPGGVGSNAIWMSTRSNIDEPWADPIPVTSLNRPGYQGRAALSFDGKELYFFWAPPGSSDYDLYVSTRVKQKD